MTYFKIENEDGEMFYKDGKFIPVDERNSDYKKVLKWIDKGNKIETKTIRSLQCVT